LWGEEKSCAILRLKMVLFVQGKRGIIVVEGFQGKMKRLEEFWLKQLGSPPTFGGKEKKKKGEGTYENAKRWGQEFGTTTASTWSTTRCGKVQKTRSGVLEKPTESLQKRRRVGSPTVRNRLNPSTRCPSRGMSLRGIGSSKRRKRVLARAEKKETPMREKTKSGVTVGRNYLRQSKDTPYYWIKTPDCKKKAIQRQRGE